MQGEFGRVRPLVALTLGDVAGIGPEIVVRAGLDARVRSLCHPVAVGHPTLLERAARTCGIPLEVRTHSSFAQVRELRHKLSGAEAEGLHASSLDCLQVTSDEILDVTTGSLDGRAGHGAWQMLTAAARGALDQQIDAIVTAPLNKESLHLGGHDYPGHTELLAEICGVDEFAMMLYLTAGSSALARFEERPPSAGLGVAHVTLHTSIRSVPDLLSRENILEKIVLIDGFLRRMGQAAPRIGVCALNPHGGEGGLFGDEETRWIRPAVETARGRGIAAHGPYPADTLLLRAVRGEFEGVVAMYHDQGHIALKLIGFQSAVNVTLGLPIVRTSPSHGTAFDIAGQGRASAEGMIEAIRVAVQLATR